MKIELAHDIIARKVYDMASTEDKMRLKVERFIKEEHSHYKDRNILLQKKELDYINPYLNDITLTEEQKLFIEKSEKLIRWKQLRSLVSMAAFAVLIGIFAVYQSATKGKLQAANKTIKESETKFKLLYCLSEAKKAFSKNQTDLSFRLTERAKPITLDKSSDPSLVQSLKAQVHEIQQSPLRYRLWHKETITSIDFSDNQRYYVTAGRDGKATLWNSKGEWIRRFLHADDVVSVAFTPDSRQVFTASLDSTACFWGVNGTRDVIMKADHSISQAILSPNGRRVFTIYGDTGGKIWTNKGGTVKDVKTKTKIIGADFMPDGKRLLYYGEKSNVVFVWTEDNESIVIIPTSSQVVSAQFSPRDGAVMVLTKDGSIRFWNNGNIRSYFADSDFDVTRAKLSPTGNLLLVANDKDEAELWERDGGFLFHYEQNEDISSFDWSSDGSLFALVDKRGKVEIHDNKGILVDEFTKKRMAHFIKFSPNNKLITFLDYSNIAKIWTIQENLERTLAFDAVILPEVAFIQYTNKFIAMPTQDDKAILWNEKGQKLAEFRHKGLIKSIKIAHREDKILTASADGKAIVWDTLGKRLEELPHKGNVLSALFSPNDQEIITISTDNKTNLLSIWGIGGDKIKEVTLNDTPVEIHYSPNGKYIALVVSGQLILMDNRGNEIERLEEGTYIQTIIFSNDSKHLAALQGALVKVWDLTKPNYDFYELEHDDVANSVVFSNNNKNILTSSDEGKVRYWDISGNEQFYIDHVYSVKSAAFSSDDQRIVTTTSDGRINVFDLLFDKNNKIAKGATQQISLLQRGVRYAKFSPDDNRMISIGDNQATIWRYITLDEIMKFYAATSRQLTTSEEENYELEQW